MALAAGTTSRLLRSRSRRLARAAWAKCIKRTTPSSGATWPSKFCRKRLRTIPNGSLDFSAKRKCSLAESSEHRNDLRPRTFGRHKLSRHGVGARRDSGGAQSSEKVQFQSKKLSPLRSRLPKLSKPHTKKESFTAI